MAFKLAKWLSERIAADREAQSYWSMFGARGADLERDMEARERRMERNKAELEKGKDTDD